MSDFVYFPHKQMPDLINSDFRFSQAINPWTEGLSQPDSQGRVHLTATPCKVTLPYDGASFQPQHFKFSQSGDINDIIVDGLYCETSGPSGRDEFYICAVPVTTDPYAMYAQSHVEPMSSAARRYTYWMMTQHVEGDNWLWRVKVYDPSRDSGFPGGGLG